MPAAVNKSISLYSSKVCRSAYQLSYIFKYSSVTLVNKHYALKVYRGAKGHYIILALDSITK
jgi:hypothetical protein